MQIIGKERGLLGFEATNFTDKFEFMGGSTVIDGDKVFKKFDKLFSLAKAFETLLNQCNGMNCGKIQPLVDCFSFHFKDQTKGAAKEALFDEDTYAMNKVPLLQMLRQVKLIKPINPKP